MSRRRLRDDPAYDQASYVKACHDPAIYFIQSGGPNGPVKIGYSNNVPKRLENLQQGNPYELKVIGVRYNATRGEERSYHKMFAADRMHGEWFKCSPALMAEAHYSHALTNFTYKWANYAMPTRPSAFTVLTGVTT